MTAYRRRVTLPTLLAPKDYDPVNEQQFRASIEDRLRATEGATDPGGTPSSSLTFIQDGLGAWERTAQDKMRESFSVKDFGAVGDGTHHPLSERFATLALAQAKYPFVTSLTQGLDYAGWQAATNASILLLHRSVYAPRGHYVFEEDDEPIDPDTGCGYYGDGRFGTIVEVAEEDSGGNNRQLFLNTDNVAKGGIIIESMTIQGQMFDGTGQYGDNIGELSYYSSVDLWDVHFRNISCIGLIFSNCDDVSYDLITAADIARCPVRVVNARSINLGVLRLERTGDDPISVHVGSGSVGDAFTPSVNQDITLGDITIINCNGAIKALGARRVIVGRIHSNLTNGLIIGDVGESEGGQQPYSISIDEIELLNTTRFQTGGAATACLVIDASDARGAAATHSTIPGQWDSTDGAFIEHWDWTDGERDDTATALNPAMMIHIGKITIARTLPSIGDVEDYGFGIPNVAGTYTNQAMTDANLRPGLGINLPAFLHDVTVDEYSIRNVTTGMQTQHWKHTRSLKFGKGYFYDTPSGAWTISSQPASQETLNATFNGATFNVDPFCRNSNSNTNGTYDANGSPLAINSGANIAGMHFIGCQFMHCCQIMNATGLTLQNWFACVAYVGPTALGFNTANESIGNIPNVDGIELAVIDGDPTSATYFQSFQRLERASSSMPASGWYPIGWFVRSLNPTTDALLGWSRVTSDDAHVDGTDWVAVYGVTDDNVSDALDNLQVYAGIPQNSKSTDYTLVLGDAQKHILHPAADNNPRTFTIPANGSVAYPVGTVVTFVNEINTITIAITTDTLNLAGAGGTGSRTLAANGMATALKTASTSWWISGVGLT